jgi:hypothetical protein
LLKIGLMICVWNTKDYLKVEGSLIDDNYELIEDLNLDGD